MTPQILLAAGLLLMAAAAGILRSYGPRYRVARLLATLQPTPLAEVLEAAGAGPPRYLRVDGRLDSEEAFEDAARRPLVFRRTRVQVRSRGGWATVEDGREQVPFEVGDGLQAISIDAASLGDGLVVIPRESTGTVADLADRAPEGLTPGAPARALIEHVSAVDQAIVLGVPGRGPDGTLRMSAGLGRPLVLTVLEVPEALRIIGGETRLRPVLVAALGGTGLALVVLAAMWAAAGAVVGAAG